MPFDVNVRSLDAALEVVAGAAAPNGGIAIDTWHMSKLGIAPDDLRRIPLEYLSWIELSDGHFADMDDPIDEVINHRNLPGEGEFDVSGVCRGVPATTAIPAHGASRSSPKNCATIRSTSSSGARTTRPPPNSRQERSAA